jgi:hypothetical protein
MRGKLYLWIAMLQQCESMPGWSFTVSIHSPLGYFRCITRGVNFAGFQKPFSPFDSTGLDSTGLTDRKDGYLAILTMMTGYCGTNATDECSEPLTRNPTGDDQRRLSISVLP